METKKTFLKLNAFLTMLMGHNKIKIFFIEFPDYAWPRYFGAYMELLINIPSVTTVRQSFCGENFVIRPFTLICAPAEAQTRRGNRPNILESEILSLSPYRFYAETQRNIRRKR